MVDVAEADGDGTADEVGALDFLALGEVVDEAVDEWEEEAAGREVAPVGVGAGGE